MKKYLGWIALVGVLVLLAAGAYTAVGLLTAQDVETAAPAGGRTIQTVNIVNGGDPVTVTTTILPAEELPDSASTAFGVLKSLEDNTILMGTGSIDLEVDIDVDGDTGQETVSLIPTTSGPDVEVVITADTIIYKDVTDLSQNEMTESGEQTILQAVQLVNSIESIEENSELEVWGEQRGDRIVATVLVYGPLGGGAFQ